MTLLEQFTTVFADTFQRVFGVATTSSEPTPTSNERVIALPPLLDIVSDLLKDLNQEATVVDSETGTQRPFDWDEYFTPLDIYFDDDGSLFLLVSRRGGLYRLPITIITDNSDNTQISFGQMIQIPLNRTQNSFNVVRTAAGELRWFAIAASAVLNRENEIDSTRLYDNFIRRAEDTGVYPILSFYHKKNTIRLGQATWLARDGFLYLTAGDFDNTPDGEAAANALEQRSQEWGVSIGYYPIGEPEFLEVAPGVTIPVFNDGFNDELSIVLERDAAAHFTQVGAQEVTRTMRKAEYEALVLMFGEGRAQELAAQIDGTNRTIEAEGLIARAQTAEPVAETEMTTPTTQVETEVTARQVELDDDLVQQIAHAFTQSDAWQTMQTNLTELNETVREVVPALNANTTNLEAIQATVEERLAALERDDANKQREWQQDLPQPQTRYSYRPREQRMPQPVEGAVPSMELAAQQTLAKMKTRQPQAQQ